MTEIRRLTPALRKNLQEPMGLLIRGSFEETMKTLRELIAKEKPSKIVSVGDTVSESMIKHGVSMQVLIVDNKVMREPTRPIAVDADQTLYVKNPPGTLDNHAWDAVRAALRGKRRTKVLVDGEEDLLTLVAVLHAPKNSFVIYGQPREGIVVVKVTDEAREIARRIVDAMEKTSKS